MLAEQQRSLLACGRRAQLARVIAPALQQRCQPQQQQAVPPPTHCARAAARPQPAQRRTQLLCALQQPAAWRPASASCPLLLPASRSSMRTFSAADAATAGASASASEAPIVVTASWLGAKKRPFSKYRELWHSLGCANVLAARPPMASIVLPPAGQLLAAAFTRRLLAAAAASPRAPIFVHLFSGGGYIFMGWVWQLLAELEGPGPADVRRRVAGLILDSSPARVTPDVASRALVAATLGVPAAGIEASHGWLVAPVASAVRGYLALPYVHGALAAVEDAWLRDAPRCPRLLLYSDADVLVPPEVVEEFCDSQRRALGVATYARRWPDSAHVDHFRAYPEEYAQALRGFMADALAARAACEGASSGSVSSSVGSVSGDASSSGGSSVSSSSSSSSVSGDDVSSASSRSSRC